MRLSKQHFFPAKHGNNGQSENLNQADQWDLIEMRSIFVIIVAFALMGLAGAVSSIELFNQFVQEDKGPLPAIMNNTTEAWNAVQPANQGGFDYAEVAEMTMLSEAFSFGALVPVGKVAQGKGHYKDGVTQYIQA